jgi:type IV secretory pathway VirB10-like protein
MANIDLLNEAENETREQLGGGRFSRLLGISFVVIAMVGGAALAIGLERSGPGQTAATDKAIEDPNAEARDSGEIADLAAHGSMPHGAPSMMTQPVMPQAPAPVQRPFPQAPSRYAQWAEDKYMKALEAPQMVGAFHHGETLEIASGKAPSGNNFGVNSSSNPTVTLHPPASPFTVMAGSVIPAVLVSGINSDLPGPILAQVSENVGDSATGQHVLVPQGSRLIGAYQNAASNNQQRIQIAWQRLIFPDTSSMDLPQMPGTDQSGYAGFSDQTDHHYLSTFGTAALISLISAGQMVGQMAGFGGGGTYGAYGYYQPNQWAMAGETAGSAASSQMGAVGQQMLSNGMNRPPTIEIRPGYQFNVMVTQDLVFPNPYGK